MSRRMMKVLLMGALVVSALASAGSASAANWQTNGPINYTATAPAAKLTIASPSNPVTICNTVSATGNLVAGNVAVNTASWNTGNVTPKFTSCTIAGLTATVNCTTNAASLIVDPPVAQPQLGRITGIACTIVRGTCTISVAGTVNASYVNATGVQKVFKAGQVLNATAPAGCSSITGSASGGTWTANYFNNVTNGDLDYTVTSTPKPSIT
jgi:hypothetical protein